MQPEVIGFDSLVIPTGATTGERIEINVNDSGLINVFNSSNQLVDSIGGPDGSIKVLNSSGQIVDEININRGFIAMTATTFAQLNAGGLSFGNYNPNTDAVTPDGSLFDSMTFGAPNFQPALKMNSGSLGGFTPTLMEVVSGISGNVSGSGLVGRIVIRDLNLGQPVDVYLSGNIIATDNSSNPVTWQVPTLNAGFTNDNCQYRMTSLDAMQWQGEVSINAAQGAAGAVTIMTLAAPFIPKKELIVPASWRSAGGLSKGGNAFFAFETNGTVMVGFSGATAAGDRFSCSSLVALNIIP